MLAVEQGTGLAPDPVPAAVELECRQGVHRGPDASGGDPVVNLGRAHRPVSHEVPEHVNGRSRVGVTLGEAVPVGVEENGVLVELASVFQPQRRQRADPGTMAGCDDAVADGPFPFPVPGAPGEQGEFGCRGIGIAGPDPLLLAGDHRGGLVGDGQPLALPVGLEVGIDQGVFAVGILVQAVPAELAGLGWPAAGVHEQLDRCPDGGACRLFQRGKRGDQLVEDAGGQGPPGLVVVGLLRDVVPADGEVIGQPGHGRPARVRPRARHSRRIMATWRQVTERDHDDIWPVAWRWLSRLRNAMMSLRPSADGSSPWSSRCSRRLADSSPTRRTWLCRVEVAWSPRPARQFLGRPLLD